MMIHSKQQRKESGIDIKEFISLNAELDKLREERNIPYRKNFLERLGEWYLDFSKKMTIQTSVNKKLYCRLCLLGVFGAHHFYAKHWIKGSLYLLLCWTGIPVAMTLIDWMIAVPKEADDSGMIEV